MFLIVHQFVLKLLKMLPLPLASKVKNRNYFYIHFLFLIADQEDKHVNNN